MATKVNPSQLTLTGSNASVSSGIDDLSVFIVHSGSSDSGAVKTVTAATMQDYFSKIDIVETATDASFQILFADDDTAGGGDGVVRVDGSHLNYNPSSNIFTVGGNISAGNDVLLASDASVLSFGAGADVTFTHDNGVGLDIASAGDFDIASTGNTTITSTVDEAASIYLRENAGTSGTIKIHADQGTSVTEGAASVSLLSDVGGVELRSTANLANAVNLTVDGGTTSTMTLFNDQGTSVTEGAASIQLLSDAGGVGIKSTANLAGALRLTADGGAAETIIVHADQSTVEGASGAGAIQLIADAGGISLNAAVDKDIFVHGGQVAVSASHNVANAILLHANAGTSETIKIHSDQGTSVTEGAASVQLLSDAGGIGIKSTANLADAVLITVDGGTSETIKVHSDQGTGAGSIALLSDAGGVSIDGGSTSHGVKIGTATSTAPVTIGHSTSEVTVADNLTVAGNHTVAGNLTVNGTTTTVNSTTLTVDDTIIVLGQGNVATSKDLGVLLERSGSNSNVALFYDESEDYFQLYQGLAEDGSSDTFDISTGSYAELRLGSLVASGSVDLGLATSHTITANGRFDSNLVPSTDNARDLGTSALQWKDLHLNGTANLDAVDIDGATQIDATVTVGVDDTGYDVKFFGATSGKSLLWDESADSLIITGDATDALKVAGGLDIDGVINVGLDDTGYDVKFFGDTASAYMQWDASADDLILGGAAGIIVPDGQLTLGSTAVTSTAAEINVLDGYADETFVATADSIVFADADASTGGSDLRRESTSDFLTAIAGAGLEVASSQLKIDQRAQFFNSASMTNGSGATVALNLDSAVLTNSLEVYLNGVLQILSGALTGSDPGDFQVSGTSIIMNDVLHEQDILTVRYIKS
tara:strand:+ start:2647 stop:5283 length:2637 start_codon:yes stop_codon:yes gene_type:complete